MDHCCEVMVECLKDGRVQIKYDPQFREYFIPLIFRRELMARQGLDYCPWCGNPLPASVRDLYYDILEKEYGVDDPIDPEQMKLVPEEFNSDAWWKKRKL